MRCLHTGADRDGAPVKCKAGSLATWLTAITNVPGTGQYWAVGSTSHSNSTLAVSCQ